MTSAAQTSGLAPDFDKFLFAEIGEGKNGMLLSVLSAFARLDLDRWQEASRLAGLPKNVAADRLARLIASLPDEPTIVRDKVAAAARLIQLLPRGAKSGFTPGKTGPAASAEKRPRSVLQVIVINLVLMTVLLGTQWVFAIRSSGPPLSDTAPSAFSTSAPDTSSSDFPR
jgi:hypothetical protein